MSLKSGIMPNIYFLKLILYSDVYVVQLIKMDSNSNRDTFPCALGEALGLVLVVWGPAGSPWLL